MKTNGELARREDDCCLESVTLGSSTYTTEHRNRINRVNRVHRVNRVNRDNRVHRVNRVNRVQSSKKLIVWEVGEY